MSPRTRWSPPEQKASGPSPVRTITPTDASSRARSSASDELDHGLRAEGVAHLRAVDRDLRDPVAAQLVADVLVLRRLRSTARSRRVTLAFAPHGLRPLALRRRRAPPRAGRDQAGDEEVTYRELLLRAVRAAGALHLRGAGRGEPVALLAPARPAVPRGAARLPHPRRAGGPDRPAARRPGAQRGPARDRDPRRAPDDGRDRRVPAARPRPSARRSRSSSTRRARRAVRQPVGITYGNIRANARGLAQAMQLGDDERWLCPLPLSHVGGLMVFLRSTIMATTAILAPPPFDAEAVARSLRDDEDHDRLARADAAAAAARRRRDARAQAAPRAARRGRDAARAARARPRRGLPGEPELRAHPGVLDGHGRASPATWRPRGARCRASAWRSPPTARSSSPAAR